MPNCAFYPQLGILCVSSLIGLLQLEGEEIRLIVESLKTKVNQSMKETEPASTKDGNDFDWEHCWENLITKSN